MKKLITLILLVSAFYCNGQKTTQTEYNYIKKSIIDIDEKGADVKSGYSLKTLAENTKLNGILLTARALYRSNGTLAGISIKTEYKEPILVGADAPSEIVSYYCIPAADGTTEKSYGKKQFFEDVSTSTTNDEKTAIILWLSYGYAYLSGSH